MRDYSTTSSSDASSLPNALGGERVKVFRNVPLEQDPLRVASVGSALQALFGNLESLEGGNVDSGSGSFGHGTTVDEAVAAEEGGEPGGFDGVAGPDGNTLRHGRRVGIERSGGGAAVVTPEVGKIRAG